MTARDEIFASEDAVPTAHPGQQGPGNAVVKTLVRNGPSTAAELPAGNPKPSGGAREVVAKVKVSSNQRGTTKNRGKTTDVYHLYGEERRAVRRFIDENTEYVRGCLTDNHSPVHAHPLYELFVEEWLWREWREDGGSE